jgi:hypothetical protein
LEEANGDSESIVQRFDSMLSRPFYLNLVNKYYRTETEELTNYIAILVGLREDVGGS